MLIGELVKRTGLTRDTIRFYEKKGLISLDSKYRRENNYKEYPKEILDKLILIKNLKKMGFTLTEIGGFFEAWREDDASCSHLKGVFENKITQLDKQIQKLQEVKARLSKSLVKCDTGVCDFENAV